MRNMSPQAYRRLREKMTEGELRDLARDINSHIRADMSAEEVEAAIFHVLTQISPYTNRDDNHGSYDTRRSAK